MGRNGQSVYDIVSESYRRTVTTMNSDGVRGVSIPKDYAESEGIELGDEVALIPDEDRDGVLELHFR